MKSAFEAAVHIRALAGTTGLDTEEVIELLRLFCDTSNADLDQMGEALESGNFSEVCARAHSIKGAALNLCLPDFAHAAASIEDAARRGAAERARLSVDLLRKRVAASGEVLKAVNS